MAELISSADYSDDEESISYVWKPKPAFDFDDDEEVTRSQRREYGTSPDEVQEIFFERLSSSELRAVHDQSQKVSIAWKNLKKSDRRAPRLDNSDEDEFEEIFDSEEEEEEHERPDGVLLRFHYGCWWDYPPALAKHICESFQEYPRIYERWDRNRVDPDGLALRLGVTIMTEPMVCWAMRYERERSETARRQLYPQEEIYAKYIETVSAEAARMRATTPDKLLKVESDYPDEAMRNPVNGLSDVKAAVRIERKSQVRPAMAEMLSIFAQRPTKRDREAGRRGSWWNDTIDVNADDAYENFHDFEQDKAYSWPRYMEEVKQKYAEPVELYYERLLKVAKVFRIEEPRISEAFYNGMRKYYRNRLERLHESMMFEPRPLQRYLLAARQYEMHVFQTNMMKRMSEEANERDERVWEEEFD